MCIRCKLIKYIFKDGVKVTETIKQVNDKHYGMNEITKYSGENCLRSLGQGLVQIKVQSIWNIRLVEGALM